MSTSIDLRPMSDAELALYMSVSRRDYIEDLVRMGMKPEAAAQKADRDVASLSDPAATQDVLVVESAGEAVGALWVGPLEEGATFFIFDIRIDDAHQGRGFGRATMLEAERLAREAGAEAVKLHVFGDNQVARGLYRSLGFVETNVNMTKRL